MVRTKRYLASLVTCMMIGCPTVGWATTSRFLAPDWWPSLGETGFFSVSSSQPLYHLRYSFALSNAFVLRPLKVKSQDGSLSRSVVDYTFAQFLSGGIGLMDSWQAGLTLPLYSQVRFHTPDFSSTAGPEDAFRVGDLKISSKVRLRDSNRYRLGAAVEPFVTFPLGADDRFLGESAVTGGLKAIGDYFVTNRMRLALNLGAKLRTESVAFGSINFQHELLSGLGLSFQATSEVTVFGEVTANSAMDELFSNLDTTPIEFLGGVQWSLGETGFTLGLGGGTCGVCGIRGARARGVVSFGYRRIHESYVFKERQEEEMRVVMLRPREEEAYAIYELVDECPIELGKFRIRRDDPRCQQIYEVQKLARTCPEEKKFKRRQDDPECRRFYALRHIDSDRDGLPDYQDLCPIEKGKKKLDGCPKEPALTISQDQKQLVTEPIQFENGKATFMKESTKILDLVARTLRAQPALTLLSIEGHTDSIGSAARNLSLSRSRAKAVYQYLVKQGTNPKRLTFKGLGETRPAVENTTDEGRTRNRRVEFVIKKTSDIVGTVAPLVSLDPLLQ